MSMDEFHECVNEFFDLQGWSTPVTLQKLTGQSYDVDTSENVPTYKNIAMQGIPLDYLNKNEGTSTNANTLIKSGDKQLYIKPHKLVNGIDPSTDKIILGGKTYRIVTVKEMNVTGVDVLYYELFIRF